VSPALAGGSSLAALPAGTLRQLVCVGPAVPSASWADYFVYSDSVPKACALNASPFESDAESFHFLDPSFTSARTWRGNVSYTSELSAFTYTLEGVYSLNLRRAGLMDLNFSNQEHFVLPSEGSRPIFVAASDIVPTSGLL